MTNGASVGTRAVLARERATASILIVHRSELIGEGLRLAMSRWPALEVVGTASGGDHAVALASRRWPDMVLLDADLSDEEPWGLVDRLRSAVPHLRVILFLRCADAGVLRRGRAFGVAGYVRQGASQEVTGRAIHAAAAGEEFVDRDLAGQMVAGPDVAALSDRETEVLQLVADGLGNVSIAQKLGIGEETIKTHMKRILGKLQAHCRAHAVAIGLRRRLIL